MLEEWREWCWCAHTSYLSALRFTLWQIFSGTMTEVQTSGLFLVFTFGLYINEDVGFQAILKYLFLRFVVLEDWNTFV